MNKKALFEKLCYDVQVCSVCSEIYFSPHLITSDHFIHERTVENINYVNKWNLVQGSLDAEIMVIGQDYGVADTNYFTTDKSLKKLFLEVFETDIEKTDERLFFTNIANCYRSSSSTGSLNKGCLALCANKFMSRLINIIRPKIIIVLGLDAFQALACCDNAKLICKNPGAEKDNKFGTISKYDYKLITADKEIAVFPVYHPGSNGQRNRKYAQQVLDWTRIKEYYINL